MGGRSRGVWIGGMGASDIILGGEVVYVEGWLVAVLFEVVAWIEWFVLRLGNI